MPNACHRCRELIHRHPVTHCGRCGTTYLGIEQMTTLPVLVVDTETGGVDPLTTSLLSVAFVSRTSELSFYVKEPRIRVTPEAMAINKIDLRTVRAEGLTITEACNRINAYLEQLAETEGVTHLTGHNVGFDVGYLKRLYRLAKQPFPKSLGYRTVDTHSVLWSMWQLGLIPYSATKSDGAFKHFEVMTEDDPARHTALGDARATYAMAHKMLDVMRSQVK